MRLSPQIRDIFVLLVIALGGVLTLTPGAGIETRQFSEFPIWMVAVFFAIGLVFLVVDVAALIASWWRPRLAAYLAILAAITLAVIVVPDLLEVAGPPPPAGVAVVEVIEVVIVALIFLLATRMLVKRLPAEPTAPPGRGPPS